MEDFKTRLLYNRDAKGRQYLLLFSLVYTAIELVALGIWKVAKPIFFCLSSRVSDGYWLILLSPIVLLSWIAGGVVLVVLSVVPAALAVVLTSLSAAVAHLLELPADFINKKNGRGNLKLSDNLIVTVGISSIVTLVFSIVLPLSLCCSSLPR